MCAECHQCPAPPKHEAVDRHLPIIAVSEGRGGSALNEPWMHPAHRFVHTCSSISVFPLPAGPHSSRTTPGLMLSPLSTSATPAAKIH